MSIQLVIALRVGEKILIWLCLTYHWLPSTNLYRCPSPLFFLLVSDSPEQSDLF